MKRITRLILAFSLIGSGSLSYAGKTPEQEAWEWFLLITGANTARQLLLTWIPQETVQAGDDDDDHSAGETDDDLSALLQARIEERANQDDEALERLFEELALDENVDILSFEPTEAPLTAEEFKARLEAYEEGGDTDFAQTFYESGFYGDTGPTPYDPTHNPYELLETEDLFFDEENDRYDRAFWEGSMDPISVDLYKDGGKQYGTRIDTLQFPSDNNGNLAPLPPGTLLWEDGNSTSLQSSSHDQTPVTGKVFENDGKVRHSIFTRSNQHHQTTTLRGPGPLRGSRKTIGEYPPGLSSDGYRHTDPGTGAVTSFDRGHGIDFNDGTLDSTHALENYTPQDGYYNRWIRGPLVRNIIKSGHFYIEIAIYAAKPKVTRDGTPIPEGFLFIHRNATGATEHVYYFPNWWNYRAQIKANRQKGERAYRCALRICSIEDPKLKAFVYRSTLANEEINTHIDSAFTRARELLTGEAETDAALRVAIALQLMGEAATLESNRIDGGARLLSLLTGFVDHKDIEHNPSQALTLFRMLIHRAFYHFHGLTSGYRTWNPNDDMQAQNQMVALYQLLAFVGLNIQAEIIKEIVEAADAKREFGIMLNCWNSGKTPNNCLVKENENFNMSKEALLAEFYNNYSKRTPKARVFEGIFEGAPARFPEHRIRKDGNCGFTGLGIERGDAIIQLMIHASDEDVRRLVAPDIREAIIAGDWNHDQEGETARLLYELGDPTALNAYVMRADVFQRFLLHYQSRRVWLSYIPGQTGMLDAIAHVNGLTVHVWTENTSGNLELSHQTAPASTLRGNIHLIHTDDLTHFNLLSLEDKEIEESA